MPSSFQPRNASAGVRPNIAAETLALVTFSTALSLGINWLEGSSIGPIPADEVSTAPHDSELPELQITEKPTDTE